MLNAINYNPNSSFNLNDTRSKLGSYKTSSPTNFSSFSTNNRLSLNTSRQENNDYQKNQLNNRNRFFSNNYSNEKPLSIYDAQSFMRPNQLIKQTASNDLFKAKRGYQPSNIANLNYRENRLKENEQSRRHEDKDHDLLDKSHLNRGPLCDKYSRNNEYREEEKMLRSTVIQDHTRSRLDQSLKSGNITKDEQVDNRDEIRYEEPRMTLKNTNRINRDHLLRMKRKYKQKISANVSGTKFEIG
jgi:hypothetical protein